ncbi:MAG: hypothetical protein AAGE52_27190 [Myxococcota bacterium]
MRRAWLLALVVGLCACGDDDGTPAMDSGVDAGTVTRAVFSPVADPAPFGSVPWPDDLYLDDTGRISLGFYPNESQTAIPEYPESLRAGMQDLDGFGLVSPVYFPVEGAIDASSLPQSPADSLLEGASAFLVDADPGSPTALERVPVDVRWLPDRQMIAVRPAHGHPLAPGGRYAAVLTGSVQDATGVALAPSLAFQAIRDADARPDDELLGEAYDRYSAVLASLASAGTPRTDVAALAVFRTQTVTEDLAQVRTQLRASDPLPLTIGEVLTGDALDARLGIPVEPLAGLGVEGGVLHDQIRWLIHGSFEAPNYLNEQAGIHGPFERNDAGEIVVKRTDTVPFTVALPTVAETDPVPVVIFQHGITSERGDMMGVANALCGAGYAVLAIDAPFHGLRSALGDPDVRNRFTGEDEPDGFGDNGGAAVIVDFAGISDFQGPLIDFHPIYFRDAMRQSAADLLAATFAVRASDWSAVGDADSDLSGLRFSDADMGFIGNSLGGIIGTMFIASEPDVGAAVLSVTGGSLFNLVVESPSFNPAYLPQLFPLMGLNAERIEYDVLHPTYFPEVGLWQTLLERGDSINYGRAVAAGGANVLMMMATDDETVTNIATESLARAIGLPLLDGTPRFVDVSTSETPLRGNVMAGGEALTRGLAVYAPATHGLIGSRMGAQRWERPVTPPFAAVDPPTPIANPIDDAQRQIISFFESWRSGAAEIAEPETLDRASR